MNADKESSVILEADRLQIPIASSVDSNIPLESYKRITYPILANDPIQFNHYNEGDCGTRKNSSINRFQEEILVDRSSGLSGTYLWIEQELYDVRLGWMEQVRPSPIVVVASYTTANVKRQGGRCDDVERRGRAPPSLSYYHEGTGRWEGKVFVSETQQLARDGGREGCASTSGAGWCTSRIKLLADKCHAKEVAISAMKGSSEKAGNFLPDRGPSPGEEGWKGEASEQPLKYNMVRPVQRRHCKSTHRKGISSRLLKREVKKRDVHEIEPRSPSL
ncbi:hypothetical protein AMTR_s00235p00022600 [Amborella trichopoda]|uniref:Uncharacterized protein n=1 Tax=Amborella trichopoda TaxID=13333 RepID=W1NXG3_AMBTC|nr:hypothetical protein AMTR_s00235p00022600 [Amborella trichopoda]